MNMMKMMKQAQDLQKNMKKKKLQMGGDNQIRYQEKLYQAYKNRIDSIKEEDKIDEIN